MQAAAFRAAEVICSSTAGPHIVLGSSVGDHYTKPAAQIGVALSTSHMSTSHMSTSHMSTSHMSTSHMSTSHMSTSQQVSTKWTCGLSLGATL
jgi:hypothetical protein